jgi:hypothetical protein
MDKYNYLITYKSLSKQLNMWTIVYEGHYRNYERASNRVLGLMERSKGEHTCNYRVFRYLEGTLTNDLYKYKPENTWIPSGVILINGLHFNVPIYTLFSKYPFCKDYTVDGYYQMILTYKNDSYPKSMRDQIVNNFVYSEV